MTESFVSAEPASALKVQSQPTGPLAVPPSLARGLAVGRQLSAAIEQLPAYWSDFWEAYRKPAAFLAWILVAVVAFKIVLAVLGAIHDIPLLPSLLQLAGLGYGAWFASRHLISFASRQEAFANLQRLREYLWG